MTTLPARVWPLLDVSRYRMLSTVLSPEVTVDEAGERLAMDAPRACLPPEDEQAEQREAGQPCQRDEYVEPGRHRRKPARHVHLHRR